MPLSGSLLVDYCGAKNFTTLNCSILTSSRPVHIVWSVQHLRNNSAILMVEDNTEPELFYIVESVKTASQNFFSQSYFTILNLTSELDGVIVYCGTKEEPKIANFSLRIYCK